MPDDTGHGARAEEPFLEINQGNEDSGGLSSLIFVITIVLLVLVTGFFVFYKYRTASQANDKQEALNNVLAQLNSPDNQAIETKADSVNAAVNILRAAAGSKYSFNTFITDLAAKVTNDTQLTSLSISDSGEVDMDGVTSSYRSAADLAVSLQSSPKLSNVQISGLSETTVSGASQVSFSISAQIKDWKTDTAANSSTNNGGSNE